jgi:hypothetical protein
MAIKTYVTAADGQDAGSIKTDEGEFLATLGSQEENVAIQMSELFSSISNSVAEFLQVESQLTIEITGAVKIKAQGGVNYLFFNAGAEMETNGGMKVVFTTTLKPKSSSES